MIIAAADGKILAFLEGYQDARPARPPAAGPRRPDPRLDGPRLSRRHPRRSPLASTPRPSRCSRKCSKTARTGRCKRRPRRSWTRSSSRPPAGPTKYSELNQMQGTVVQGPTAGVGVSLALACDLVIASEKAFFLLAFTKIGLMPDGGASALVAASVGRIRAMRMALLAERLPADEALAAGLVTAVHPAGDLESEANKVIERLLCRTRRRLRQDQAGHQRRHAVGPRRRAGPRDRRPAVLLNSRDFREGIKAFQEKRDRQLHRHLSPAFFSPNRINGRESPSGSRQFRRSRRVAENRWTSRGRLGDHRMVSTQFEIEQPVVARRRLARARTLPVPRVPPADRRGVAVDLRRRHVGRRDGASGHRTRQRSRVAVAGRHLPGCRPGRVRAGRRDRRRPNQPARHHHRRRDRQRDRRVDDRGAGTRWRAADLAYGGGRGGTRHRRGVLLPRLQRDPAADPARRAAAGRQRRRRRRAPGVPARRRPRRRRPRGRVRRSRRWARSWWRCCSPSACCCWWPPGRR